MAKELANIEHYCYLLFGVIAIHKGFIRNQQLREALEIQRKHPDQKLGAILLELGHLNQSQFDEVLHEQSVFANEQPDEWPYIPDTVLKGVVYFSQKPLLPIKSSQILQAQRIYEELDKSKPLGKVIAEHMKLVPIERIEALRAKIAISPYECRSCQRTFYLYNYDQQQRIHCTVCAERELMPAKIRIKALQKATRTLPKPAKSQQTQTYPQAKPNQLQKTAKLDVQQAAAKTTRQISIKPSVQEKMQDLYDDIEKLQEERKSKRAAKYRTPSDKTKTLFALEQQRARYKFLKAFSLVVGLSLLFALVVVFFVSGKTPQKNNSIVYQDIAQNPVNSSKIVAPQPKREADPGRQLVKEICRDLYRNTPPSHEMLNQMAKKLYLARPKNAESADLLNLLGRIFWYKASLSRGYFSEEWREKWQKQALESWKIAAQLYGEGKYQPTIRLTIKKWMPEENFFRKMDKRVIEYESAEQARADMMQLRREAFRRSND